MKKVLSVLLAALMLIQLCTIAMADDFNSEIKIIIDGTVIETDTPPVIINNRTMVPLRAISEALGATVIWDDENKIVKIETNKELIPVRIGTHSIIDDDPNHPQSTMSEKEANAKKIALEKVKDILGAEIQFIQYSSADYRKEIGESVEKGEPLCELAVLWNGSQKKAIEDGIIQPIDDYTAIFGNEEFPLEPKTEGHYYFMQRDFMFTTTWPVVYNMTMLDKIPELKEEDGTTLYPAELYYRGEWTWSGFEKYMEIVKSYFEKYYGYYKPVPFETNYTYFTQSALHSVGASIYDGEKSGVNTPYGLKAVEFVKGLFEKELVSCSSAEKDAKNSGWIFGWNKFANEETVFTNCPYWKLKRENFRHAVGIVPFPYPDEEAQRKNYRHVNQGGDSVGLVKGVDKETAEIAIKAYKIYAVEYCKALAGVESMAEFADKYACSDAESRGIDVTHPEVGSLHVGIWTEYGKAPINEYAEAFEKFWNWSYAFGEYAFSDKNIDEYKKELEDI